MHVAVLGAGAIGSALGSKLARSETVTLIGHDNPHLRRLRDTPVSVQLPDGSSDEVPVTVTTNHGAVAGADLVVLAVKSYDTEAALADIEPFLEETEVLTLQNGLGNIEQIRESIEPERVIGGTTTMAALVPEPGVVRIESVGETKLGRPWGATDALLQQVAETFETAGFPTRITNRIRAAIWEKVLVNVGINPVTALGGVPNGHLRTGPGRTLLRTAIEEAETVAEAEGFDCDTAVEHALTIIEKTTQNRSSMLRDLETGSETEIDSLNGAIVERARYHDISVPVNRTLTAAIRLRSGQDESF